jgi:hypothetical protein
MLSDEQCDKLTVTLQTGGWREVMVPVIAKQGQDAIKALCIPLANREGVWKGVSDDGIRGALSVYEYILSAFQNEVTVNRANKQREDAQNGTEAAQGQPSAP